MRAEGSPTHLLAIVPAALVTLSAVLLFWALSDWGYVPLVAGVVGGILTDRAGLSRKLGQDLAIIAIALTWISFISLHADLSDAGILRFAFALGGAVLIPYSISRWLYRDHAVRFPWKGGRWTRRMWTYLVVVVFAAYLILPFYFLTSGVYRNWPAVEDANMIARLFMGVNAVGLWDELFFICTVYTLLLRHFRPWLANLLQAGIFVSFLWELGYQAWGPLLTIPFALVQGAIFSWTKNLFYVVTVHLLFDAVVFLVIVHAHHPEALPIFPLVHGF
ncbi:CPBP family glutamic-type intramembrane protease [Agrococcus sp. HG114]|uniref:CPBP family glutamic-type intramembrane protease n=1 Tax=Agrococcus sp. HG114 TaxID=2969757 RepID=UPI00215B63A9|nr:CPBP family intramembrane glutamic endopeptidase [Agrococcus sp. HG114]MCR8670093.1 CPBP family intramembrane metalloprotease [Agrococcus sp. HG114]